MKVVKNNSKMLFARIIGMAAIFAIVLSGCASILKSKAKYEILDHSGAALGNNEIPKWLAAYLDAGGVDTAVESLSEFSGKYCFIGTAEGANKDFVQTWARSVSAPQIIATTISNRFEELTSAERKGDPTATDRAINQQMSNNVSATFNGARPVGNWWIWMRSYDPKKKSVVLSEDYRSYALYTFDKKSLDKQIAAELQNTIDNRKSMSAEERSIYSNLIQQILTRGLGL